MQDITPNIYMADSDFDAITNNRAICNSDGNVGPKEFCEIMTKEIRSSKPFHLHYIISSFPILTVHLYLMAYHDQHICCGMTQSEYKNEFQYSTFFLIDCSSYAGLFTRSSLVISQHACVRGVVHCIDCTSSSVAYP
jgi:hypothetical protein